MNIYLINYRGVAQKRHLLFLRKILIETRTNVWYIKYIESKVLPISKTKQNAD